MSFRDTMFAWDVTYQPASLLINQCGSYLNSFKIMAGQSVIFFATLSDLEGTLDVNLNHVVNSIKHNVCYKTCIIKQ